MCSQEVRNLLTEGQQGKRQTSVLYSQSVINVLCYCQYYLKHQKQVAATLPTSMPKGKNSRPLARMFQQQTPKGRKQPLAKVMKFDIFSRSKLHPFV